MAKDLDGYQIVMYFRNTLTDIQKSLMQGIIENSKTEYHPPKIRNFVYYLFSLYTYSVKIIRGLKPCQATSVLPALYKEFVLENDYQTGT